MTDGSQKQEDDVWRVLEFYSGIGGMVLHIRNPKFYFLCLCTYILMFVMVWVEILAKGGGHKGESGGSIRYK